MNPEIDISGYLRDADFDSKKLSRLLVKNKQLIEPFVKYASSCSAYSWRASWVLALYTRNHYEDLNKYSGTLISSLKNIRQDGYLREMLKIIVCLDLNEEQTSEVFDLCLTLLQDNHRQPSLRSIAFKFLLKVADDYPELQNEILIIFENIKDYLPNGIKHSMMLLLKNANLIN